MTRHILLPLLLAAIATTASAQWLRVWNGGESTRYAVSDVQSMDYTAGTLTIGIDVVSTSEIDSITIVNPVTVTYDGTTATVDIPESVEGVTAYANGADVYIVNLNTVTEQEFILKGTSTQGSLTYSGSYKVKFHLAGLDLTSTSGAAIDIQCGKRVDIIVEDGTVNTLADYASGDQKAAFNCQGHVELSGSGSLTIAGKARHALRTNEYLLVKKSFGTLTVSEAASDGIHVGEFFQMNGGTVSIAATGGDGLQVETDATSSEALNGQLIVGDGTLTVDVASADTKGIRLDADDTDATIVPHLQLLGGTITVNVAATALGAKAIASDGNFTIGSAETAPVVSVVVAAGVYTDTATGEENRATGLKADSTLTIAGGQSTVAATGAQSRGVRAYALVATGGTLTVTNTGTKSQGIKLDQTFVTGQGGIVSGSFRY